MCPLFVKKSKVNYFVKCPVFGGGNVVGNHYRTIDRESNIKNADKDIYWPLII